MPFFCAVCDKKIEPKKDKKYTILDENCRKAYVNSFNNDFSEKITTLPNPDCHCAICKTYTKK